MTTSIAYADEIRSVRLEQGDTAPFPGTLYNEAGDREINLVLLEAEEYEKALGRMERQNGFWKTVAGIASIVAGVLYVTR